MKTYVVVGKCTIEDKSYSRVLYAGNNKNEAFKPQTDKFFKYYYIEVWYRGITIEMYKWENDNWKLIHDLIYG